MLKIYTYKNCGSCKKATQWLKAQGAEFQEVAIRETPPEKAELSRMAEAYEGNLKKLFNTSGKDYHEMGIKDKLPSLSNEEVFELLGSNGNLIKRPFALFETSALVGFKEPEWETALS